MCDTPGYPLIETPEVKVDHRGILRFYMPRNHNRVNQTSLDLLQSWRGNCDVQFLIYESNPKEPSATDIGKVTDYIVGYACKGNKTLKEERVQTQYLIES